MKGLGDAAACKSGQRGRRKDAGALPTSHQMHALICSSRGAVVFR